MKTFLRSLTLIALFIGLAANVWAQVPQKFNYQAIVRNADGQLAANTNVGVRVAILDASNTEVYAETHQTTTNVNGLLVLEIGNGTPVTGTFAAINWGSGNFSISTGIDINGGTSYNITSTQPLMSVPFAMYADKVGNLSYTDIADAPTALSQFTNDITIPATVDVNVSDDTLFIGEDTVILPQGFSGDYNDLTNLPNITDTVLATFWDIFQNDTLRDSVVDLILTDSLLKATVKRVSDLTFSDTAMVMYVLNSLYDGVMADTAKTEYYMGQMYNRLIADTNTLKIYGRYVIRQLQERSDLIRSLARRIINNPTVRNYAHRAVNYVVDNYGDQIINFAMSHITASHINTMMNNSGIMDTVMRRARNMADGMVDSIKNVMISRIEDSIEAVQARANDRVNHIKDSISNVMNDALGGVDVTLTATGTAGTINGTITRTLTTATAVLTYGVVISPSADFIDAGNIKIEDQASFSQGGLSGTYYVRAYATTAKGVAYSNIVKLTL
jgi:hypothetical protein